MHILHTLHTRALNTRVPFSWIVGGVVFSACLAVHFHTIRYTSVLHQLPASLNASIHTLTSASFIAHHSPEQVTAALQQRIQRIRAITIHKRSLETARIVLDTVPIGCVVNHAYGISSDGTCIPLGEYHPDEYASLPHLTTTHDQPTEYEARRWYTSCTKIPAWFLATHTITLIDHTRIIGTPHDHTLPYRTIISDQTPWSPPHLQQAYERLSAILTKKKLPRASIHRSSMSWIIDTRTPDYLIVTPHHQSVPRGTHE